MHDPGSVLEAARRAYDHNQALMDFGATWCTARAPKCHGCTMKDLCASYPVPGAPKRSGTRRAGSRRSP